VNGGIANFVPFLNGTFETEHPEIYEDVQLHPEKKELVERLKALISNHLGILKLGIEVHARVCHENMLPLHAIILEKFPALQELAASLNIQ